MLQISSVTNVIATITIYIYIYKRTRVEYIIENISVT